MIVLLGGTSLVNPTYARSDFGGGVYGISHIDGVGRYVDITADETEVISNKSLTRVQLASGVALQTSAYARTDFGGGVYGVDCYTFGRYLDIWAVYLTLALEWIIEGQSLVSFVGIWIGQQNVVVDDWNVAGAADVRFEPPAQTALWNITGASAVTFESTYASFWNIVGAASVSFATGAQNHIVSDWEIEGRANVSFEGILRDIIHWNIEGNSVVTWLMPMGEDIGGDGTVPGGAPAPEVNIVR